MDNQRIFQDLQAAQDKTGNRCSTLEAALLVIAGVPLDYPSSRKEAFEIILGTN